MLGCFVWQFVTNYDGIVQDVHERLGHFNVPTSVIDRLGINQRDIPGVTKLKSQQQRRSERCTSGDKFIGCNCLLFDGLGSF